MGGRTQGVGAAAVSRLAFLPQQDLSNRKDRLSRRWHCLSAVPSTVGSTTASQKSRARMLAEQGPRAPPSHPALTPLSSYAQGLAQEPTM